MNNSTVYFKKYLKYKNKYLELRGGREIKNKYYNY